MAHVAFLCLGAMGGPMAGHLARAGHAVAVWNRTPAKAHAWAATHGGRVAASPAAAATGAAAVFACTGDDGALRAITAGPQGALAAMAPGSLFVDHTTVSAEATRELAAVAAARGVAWIDAPVSGGEEGARKGQLSVMAGGEAEAFARIEPLLACYARTAVRLGPTGAGQLAKMVNQICIAGLVEALAEGLRFAERAGLDPGAVFAVLAEGAAGSWQMRQRTPSMIERRFDFGFAVDWMRKDLGIALDEARRNGAALPITEAVDRRYAALQARGHGRLDTSSLVLLLDEG
ncbi:MAG: NAD(P)-dependent oxidoreductase [Deltaproteobacteria bacterium]|nr:NAD(P)-dependent oxidoreductase [Deltaproteobacteria bacterium]